MSEQDRLNWVNVINFLEKEHNQISLREKEWNYQKEILTRRIESLQAQIRSNVTVCEGLVNRIKVLEVALRQQKMHKGDNNRQVIEEQKVREMIEKFKLSQQFQKNTHEEFLKEIVKDLRMQQHRPPRALQKHEQSLNKIVRESGSKVFEEKKKFGAHLDVITTMVSFNTPQNMIVTSSEDCLIKLWNLNKIVRDDHPEPIHTLRKHTGPLFSLASSPNPQNRSQSLLFSGGIQGDIKSWRVGPTSVSWVKSTVNGNEEQQTIWQLQTFGDKLLSASSDGVVRLFNIEGGEEPDLTFVSSFREKQFNHNSLRWISDELFLASSSSAPRIHLWNVHGSLAAKFLYEVEKGKEAGAAQVNQMAIMKDKKILLGACEDSYMRVFDLNTNKLIKKMTGKGAMSSVIGWDWTIIGGDHNGCVSYWDARMFRLVDHIENVHHQKYDTGVTCLTRVGERLLTSGADGMVKVFM